MQVGLAAKNLIELLSKNVTYHSHGSASGAPSGATMNIAIKGVHLSGHATPWSSCSASDNSSERKWPRYAEGQPKMAILHLLASVAPAALERARCDGAQLAAKSAASPHPAPDTV